MDAIRLLKAQHRDVEGLYARFKAADRGSGQRRAIFRTLAEMLAIHATLEEDLFYPACEGAGCDVDFVVMVEEHLWVKRMIADALDAELGSRFDATVEVLCESILRHAGEEEKALFKQAKAKLARATLADLGDQMVAFAEELGADAPGYHVPGALAGPAPI